MNDNDIIKALECCFVNSCCNGCPLSNPMVKECLKVAGVNAVSIINRQKAEIERLNKEVDRLSQCVLYNDGIVSDLEKEVFNAKAEAIKELAERLKKNARKFTEYDEGGWGCTVYAVKIEDIDNTVKEMAEETP